MTHGETAEVLAEVQPDISRWTLPLSYSGEIMRNVRDNAPGILMVIGLFSAGTRRFACSRPYALCRKRIGGVAPNGLVGFLSV